MPIGHVVGVGIQVGPLLIMGVVEFSVDVLGLHHDVHKYGGHRARELAVGVVDVLSDFSQALHHFLAVGLDAPFVLALTTATNRLY